MECVVSSLIIVGGVECGVVSSPIIFVALSGGVRFFFNYCWWSALFLLQLLLVEFVVSSLIIVGGVRCFCFNYYCGSALFLL